MRLDFSRLYWPAILLVTLFSLHMNLTAVSGTVIDQSIRGDAREYISYAFNLKVHGIFSIADPAQNPPMPDAIRSPGYPALIAAVIDLTAKDLGVASIVYPQAWIGALTTLLSTLLFGRMMPFWASIVGGVLVAISPHLVNANVYVLTETLFTFVLIAHVYILVLAKEKESLILFLLSGMMLAASWLIRPTTLLLPLAYLGIFSLSVFKTQLGWRAVLCLMIPFALSYAGWSARNVTAIGQMSDPLLTRQFISVGSYIDLMYQHRPETYGYPYNYDPVQIKTTADAIEQTLDSLTAEPAAFIYWVLVGKTITFLAWDTTESVGDGFIFAPLESPYFGSKLFIASHDISKTLHNPLMVLAVIAAFYFFFNSRNFAIQASSIIVLYFIGFHMLGSPFPRYSIPLRPFCYGLALCMIFHLYKSFKPGFLSANKSRIG